MQEGWRYLPAFIFANFGGMIADNHKKKEGPLPLRN
jgi:hypothetical protein